MGATQSGCVIYYEHTWVHSTPCAPLPINAVVGGHDCDGCPIYVGRAYHEGDQLPAKVVPSKGCAYVCWGGEEHVKKHYEVLVGQSYVWVRYTGNVPPTAVRSGATRSGEPLYVGRGHHANSLTVGKIHPSHGCLYIPFGGQEVRVLHNYEVLIHEQREHWVTSSPNYIPQGAVVAGHDTDSAPIYVGRAMHEGEMLPAKVIPNKGCAYVCYAGYEINKYQFEVLTGHGHVWVKSHHHVIPSKVVSTGLSRYGEPLLIGRGYHHGSLTPGLVSVNQRCLYIPYGGLEIRLDQYEVLCRQ